MNDYTMVAEGDLVIVDGSYRRWAGRVLRVTNTLIVLKYGNGDKKFRRKDGWQHGGSEWRREYIVESDPAKVQAIADEIERGNKIARMRKSLIEALPRLTDGDKIQSMWEILNKGE